MKPDKRDKRGKKKDRLPAQSGKEIYPFKLLYISTSSENSIKKELNLVTKLCSSGLKAVQLRPHQMNSADYLKTAKEYRKITTKFNSRLLINDRLDIAILSKADGFHCPANLELTPYPSLKKRGVNSDLIFGKSTHSLADSKAAEKSGFDYIIFGPVYRTKSKIKYGPPQGLNKLKMICDNVNIPVFAVGGINQVRAIHCLKKGAYGIAVISELKNSANPVKTLSDFKSALRSL